MLYGKYSTKRLVERHEAKLSAIFRLEVNPLVLYLSYHISGIICGRKSSLIVGFILIREKTFTVFKISLVLGARVITLYSRQQNMDVSVTSCVRGYHEYQDIWMPFIGETLLCGRQSRQICSSNLQIGCSRRPRATYNFVLMFIIY